MHAMNVENHKPSFWDNIAPKYARKPVADPVAYEQKLTQVRSLLRPTDRVLEIGCGTGSTALRIAGSVSQVTATDMSHGMIRIAQSKLVGDAPANVSFHQADAIDPMEGGPFDVICAFSLLHLVNDLPLVLSHVRGHLKPGGLFISKTVCLKQTAWPIRIMVRILTAIGIAPHVVSLGEADLVRHLKDAGFSIDRVSYFGKKQVSPFIVARRVG